MLTADRMALDSGTINVGAGVVALGPASVGRPIDLGGTGDPAGTLQLSDVELNLLFRVAAPKRILRLQDRDRVDLRRPADRRRRRLRRAETADLPGLTAGRRGRRGVRR